MTDGVSDGRRQGGGRLSCLVLVGSGPVTVVSDRYLLALSPALERQIGQRHHHDRRARARPTTPPATVAFLSHTTLYP